MMNNNILTKDQIEEKLILDSMHNDLLSYTMGIYPNFIVTDFHEAVAYEIQEVLEGRNDRLILTAPPRHGKSLITSEIAPAWFLGKYPDRKVIAASHTQDLADRFGAKVRDNMITPLHESVFGFAGSLKNKSRAGASSFTTNLNGEYNTVGVGGTPIGKGADVFFIDDPIRNREDVESERKRELLKSWYSSSVLSRLEGQAGIILMHQRWHEDDLAGWLLREYPEENWKVVNFPALIETEEDREMDYLHRNYNEVLIPQLHSFEKLQRLKSSMQPRDWLSMYQGHPRSSTGDEFSETSFERYETDPSHVRQGCNVYIIVDPATTKKKTSDYTAMVVIGTAADGNFYILDIVRDRLDLLERTETLINLHRKWQPIMTIYESYGMAADIQHIKHEQELQNYRFPIMQISTKVKKEERIRRLIPDMHNGRWYVPSDGIIKHSVDTGEEMNVIEDIIKEEMIPFPVGKHDDGIDAISRIYDIDFTFPSFSGKRTTNRGKKISPW